MKENELKMKLLEQLMNEMDEAQVSRLPLKKKMEQAMEEEPVAVIEEKKVVPMDQAEDALKDKLSEAMSADEAEVTMDEPEMEDDEDLGDSALMRRLKAAKARKALKE